MKSLSRARGQTGGEGFLGIAVIEPEDGQAERQVKDKDAEKLMAEAAMMGKGNEVFEIWRKAADD